MAPSEFGALAQAGEFWDQWGFVPWSQDGMEGVWRRVTVSKGALLGEVARYYAHDNIVWRHRGEPDCQAVFENCRPAADVMLHRFVFIVERPERHVLRRSFLLGLRGYIEVYRYAIGGKGPRPIRDLTPLIDQAWRIVQEPAGR